MKSQEKHSQPETPTASLPGAPNRLEETMSYTINGNNNTVIGKNLGLIQITRVVVTDSHIEANDSLIEERWGSSADERQRPNIIGLRRMGTAIKHQMTNVMSHLTIVNPIFPVLLEFLQRHFF